MMMEYTCRLAEPEHMTPDEEAHYARADYAAPHDALADAIAHAVGPRADSVAVDLGCGPGDVLLRLRRRVPWTLLGLDLSAHMLEMASHDARRRLDRTERPIAWVLGDVKDTGLPPAFADVIISNSVLHHVADATAFWRELRRLARPGAHVFVRDLRRPADEWAAREIVARNIPNESQVVKDHYMSSLRSSYTTAEVEAQLEGAGMAGLTVTSLADRYLDVSGRLAGASRG